MKCKDCVYNWSDWDEDGNAINRPHCHFISSEFLAPCEQGGEDREDEE